MDKVQSMTVHEVGKAGSATDTCKRADLFMRDLKFLKDFEEGGQYGKVPAGWTPGRMIGK